MKRSNTPQVIAMIPARMGSQRVPQKNVRILGDHPLLGHAIRLAKSCDLFDHIVVNSEDDQLLKLAEQYQCETYQRPSNLGDHQATNRDFVTDFLKKFDCTFLVMINTTSPLLRPASLKKFVEYTLTHQFDTVLSTVKEKAETFFEGKPLNFSLSEKINSQDLPETEKVVWALTAWRRSSFLEAESSGHCGVFTGHLGRFELPKDETVDIDEEEDWKLAEALWSMRKTKEIQPAQYWAKDHHGLVSP